MSTTEFTSHAPFGPQTVPPGVRVGAVASPAGPLSALWAAASVGSEGSTGVDAEARGTAMLVPGFTGSKEDFLGILPLLACRGWNVLAYSQRGQADSAAPDGVGEYRLEDFAADAVTIAGCLAESSAGPLHLLGHSFGGLVARTALLRDPALFASITLFSSGPAAIPVTADQRTQFAQLAQLAANPALRHLRPGVPTEPVADPAAEPLADPAAEMQRLRGLATSIDNLVGIGRILASAVDRSSELAATGVPAHVIYGADDAAWPHEQYAAEAAALGARHTVISGAEHSAQLENPPAFAEAVTDFWTEAA